MKNLADIGRLAWGALRSILGDDAYERYLAHQRRRHPELTPLARAEFHAVEQERRWSQVNHCC